jgi:phosphoribosylformylglycinamidine synthase
VPRVVVDVMLKPEILDPQGQAVVGALPRLGINAITGVRQGKRFELEIDGELTDDRLGEVRRLAETLLANPVIEDFDVRISEGGFDPLGASVAPAAGAESAIGEPVGASTVTARASVSMPEIASELERAMAAERNVGPAATVPPPDQEPEPSSEDPTASQPAVSATGSPVSGTPADSSVTPSVQPTAAESSVTPTAAERGDADRSGA